MSVKALDQTAYMLTADIDLLDVFKTEDEKINGLHVDEIVARLPKEKKVDPQKLGRSLRLLSTEHWYVLPSSQKHSRQTCDNYRGPAGGSRSPPTCSRRSAGRS